jgi:hypothetical protein
MEGFSARTAAGS